MKTNTEERSALGSLRTMARTGSKRILMILLLMLVLTGCEAKGTLSISLHDGESGTMTFSLALDKEATIALEQQAYGVTTLEELFDTEALDQAGFSVDVVKKVGAAVISLKGSFSNEKELQEMLLVLASEDVVTAQLETSQTLLKQNQDLSVVVNLDAAKKMYLEDEEVKTKVEATGIDFSEFETVVNQAFSDTTMTVKLSSKNESAEKSIAGNDEESHTVEISDSSFRTRYILNMAAAIGCLVAAAYILWRLCRKPQLLSDPKDGEK